MQPTLVPPPYNFRRLCLLQYEKETFSPLSFMELFSKLNAALSDEQLSVFAGEGRLGWLGPRRSLGRLHDATFMHLPALITPVPRLYRLPSRSAV